MPDTPAHPCRFCRSTASIIVAERSGWKFVLCTSCRAQGPTAFAAADAWDRWNDGVTCEAVGGEAA